MRSPALTTLLTLPLLASNAVEAARFPRAVKGNGFLKVSVGTVDRPHKVKRDAIDTVLDNREFFYATDIEFGTPPQTITVLVDTGSDELWINPDCRTAATVDQVEECGTYGFYDPDKSETPPIGPFGGNEINYGDSSRPSTHTSVNFVYYTDTIALGDATILNQTFGVATESEGQTQGIFGLAPDFGAGFDGESPYPLVLQSMFDQGIIDTRLFALDLRHSEAETGALIYGGIDRNKFIGGLETIPIVRGIRGEPRLGVNLDSIGLTLEDDEEGPRAYDLRGDDRNVHLDSGTTFTLLQEQVAMPLLEALNATEGPDGAYYVPCSQRERGGSVDFGFGEGSVTVRVPFSDFIVDLGDPDICLVGVMITGDQQILGDTVLRAGYFVFDWDNEAVHMAQAANCGDDDIVAVGSGGDALADITGNCDADDALFTGGPLPTATRGSGEDRGDERGGAESTQTADSDSNDDDEDDAAVPGQRMSVLLLTVGALAGGLYNSW